MIFLTLVFCVLVSGQDPLPIPTFPDQFEAKILRITQFPWEQDKNFHNVLLDVPNKAAFTAIESLDYLNLGKYWIIYSPQGAPHNTDLYNNYVYFANDTTTFDSGNKEFFCTYTLHPPISGGTFLPPTTFPNHWSNNNDKVTVQSWFSFPPNMVYKGRHINWSNLYDTWESQDYCNETGYGYAPCHTLVAVVGETEVPSTNYYAVEAKPNSFENSWYVSDNFFTFNPGKPNIELPSNWYTNCYNSDNGYQITPNGRAYVSTPDGSDNFTLSLPAMPNIEFDSGDVVVKFNMISRYCSDCFEPVFSNGESATTVTFTADNWNKPVEIFLKFLKEGESYFYLSGTGGGYSIPHVAYSQSYQPYVSKETDSGSFRVLTCKGVPGWGCDNE